MLKAKQLLFDEAVRNKDDVLIRFYRKQLRTYSRDSREQKTEVALFLRERAMQHLQESQKRRKVEIAEAKAAEQEEAKQMDPLSFRYHGLLERRPENGARIR